MDEETKGKDGHHDVNHRGGHEVAAKLEPAVSVGIRHGVCGNFAELAVERVYYREEIDGSVKEQEDDEESTTDALNELLTDG